MDIEIDNKKALIIEARIVVICDLRQEKMLRQNPRKLFLLPSNADIQNIRIVEEEVIPTMTPQEYKNDFKSEF